MNNLCNDNRFELIEKYKKKLIEATNIETAPDEMEVIDNILFRFWQMGWLESIDRMTLVKESAKTLIHSVGNSVSAKAFRNAGRLMQNAIDGEAPEFEFVQASSEISNNSDTISRQAAIDATWFEPSYTDPLNVLTEVRDKLKDLPSAQQEQQWTPCDKGEPDEDMECWVAVKTTDALCRGNFTKRYGERRDKGFITSGGFIWWNTALAWMPIYEPKPYKGKEE